MCILLALQRKYNICLLRFSCVSETAIRYMTNIPQIQVLCYWHASYGHTWSTAFGFLQVSVMSLQDLVGNLAWKQKLNTENLQICTFIYFTDMFKLKIQWKHIINSTVSQERKMCFDCSASGGQPSNVMSQRCAWLLELYPLGICTHLRVIPKRELNRSWFTVTELKEKDEKKWRLGSLTSAPPTDGNFSGSLQRCSELNWKPEQSHLTLKSVLLGAGG